MGLEHEQGIGFLTDRFYKVCEGPLLDWRMKCAPDEVLSRIPVVFADARVDEIVYRAIIRSTTSINHRELWLSEGGDSEGDDCCPSTANSSTEIAEFKLPKMEWISIGVEPRCWKEWRNTFCERYPIYKGCSPFTLVGNSVVLRDPTSDGTKTFLGMVQSELTQAIWDHLYRTAWVGKRERADEFDGILRQLENGITPIDPLVDHPTTPTTLNWAAYIYGQAAADAGATAGWGDVVLELTDPNRPADVPANNIFTVHAGLSCEFEIDLTGMNLIDVLRVWYEYVEEVLGINVLDWLLAVGRNKWKCAAQVAACMPGCQNAVQCQSWLVNDTRNTGRTEREIDYVRNRRMQIHPYDQTYNFVQTKVLGDLNKVLFLPERFLDAEGQVTWWLLWVWRNQNQELQEIFGDMPEMREHLRLLPGNFFRFDGELYDGSEFNAAQLFEDMAFLWRTSLNDCDRIRWWVDAEAMMLIQCPWLWLIIDGVECNTVTQTCCQDHNQPDMYELQACAAGTPTGNYVSALDITLVECPTDGSIQVGDEIDYLENVNTTHRGVVTAYDDTACTMTIQFTTQVDCELGADDVLARVRVVLDGVSQ